MKKIKPITKEEILSLIPRIKSPDGESGFLLDDKALLKIIVRVAGKQREIIETLNEVVENGKTKKTNTRTTKKKQ